jgi:hypothetical protein
VSRRIISGGSHALMLAAAIAASVQPRTLAPSDAAPHRADPPSTPTHPTPDPLKAAMTRAERRRIEKAEAKRQRKIAKQAKVIR